MLSRHNLTLPPQKSEPPAALHDSGSTCAECERDVFNTEFYRSLLAAAKDDALSTSWHYAPLASDVYKSMLKGCSWCTSIGNAIVMSANWDNMVHIEDRMYSSTDSEDGETVDVDETQGSPGNETNNEEGDSNFPHISDSLTAKVLDCSVTLDVIIEITKWGDSLVFNMIEVIIKVSKCSEDVLLSAMMDEEPVRIKFEVISPGTMLMTPMTLSVVLKFRIRHRPGGLSPSLGRRFGNF
jgi:hypothetical protein